MSSEALGGACALDQLWRRLGIPEALFNLAGRRVAVRAPGQAAIFRVLGVTEPKWFLPSTPAASPITA